MFSESLGEEILKRAKAYKSLNPHHSKRFIFYAKDFYELADKHVARHTQITTNFLIMITKGFIQLEREIFENGYSESGRRYKAKVNLYCIRNIDYKSYSEFKRIYNERLREQKTVIIPKSAPYFYRHVLK